MSTTQDRVVKLLEHCAEQRTYWAKIEQENPRLVRKLRQNAAADGWGTPALADDPTIDVRASDLEAVCADAVTLRELCGLLSQLPDDDWQPHHWNVLEQARTLAAEVPS